MSEEREEYEVHPFLSPLLDKIRRYEGPWERMPPELQKAIERALPAEQVELLKTAPHIEISIEFTERKENNPLYKEPE